MKRLALALLLSLLATVAHAQCNGVFPNNTVCGNITGSGNLPRPTNPSAFLGAAGGSNGQIQYNNAGALGGLTDTEVTARINAFTSALSGAAPASGGGTANFLRADGTWAPPASFVSVNTIAALRALSGASAIATPMIYVKGYTAENDGGQGFFYYVSTDTTSADNGGTIILDSNPGTAHRWYRVQTIKAEITLDQFGCVGDGVTNNATCISNAVAWITSLNGGIIHVPAKNYATASSIALTSGVKFRGVGANMLGTPPSIITYTGTGSVFTNANTAASMSGNEISDLRIIAGSITGGAGVIQMDNWSFALIQRNWITGNSGGTSSGILLQGILGNYNVISQNYIGLVNNGISNLNEQNGNSFVYNRIQPLASGNGIVTTGTVGAGFPNQITIFSNLIETTLASVVGINVFTNSDGVLIIGNRLELSHAASTGISIAVGATNTVLLTNYYSVATKLSDASATTRGIDDGLANAHGPACVGVPAATFRTIKGIVTAC